MSLMYKRSVRRSAAMATLASLASSVVMADDQPSVTPYRPSVSTPAALSAPGWVEAEVGVQVDRARSAARRDSLPYTLKLAFTPDWGVRVGGEAWVRESDDAHGAVSGVGDSSVVIKRRFAVDDANAFGLELGATMPTGRNGISSGKSDYSINGIYSADFADYHSDLNIVATRLGTVDADASRMQTLWAVSLSKSLNDRWSWTGELSGTRQRGTGSASQLLAAASYSVSKAMTLDAGLARGLHASDRQWSLFSGVTVLVGRLF